MMSNMYVSMGDKKEFIEAMERYKDGCNVPVDKIKSSFLFYIGRWE